KQVQLGFVAEEAGLVHREILEQLRQLLLALGADKEAIVAVEGLQVTLPQTAQQAVLQKMHAPLVKIHAALFIDERAEELQFGRIELHSNARCAHEFFLASLRRLIPRCLRYAVPPRSLAGRRFRQLARSARAG